MQHQPSGSHARLGSALVVEDDLGMAAALSDLLTEAGYEPVTVRSVREAESTLRADAATDVLLLDLALDDSFGTELLEALAVDEKSPPVVIVSGFALAPLVAARFAVELVRKPFEDDELFAALRRAREGGTRPKLAHA